MSKEVKLLLSSIVRIICLSLTGHKKSPCGEFENQHSILRYDPLDKGFFLQTSLKAMKILGHITHAAFDFFQVQIDLPFSDLRDGRVIDFPVFQKKHWYVREWQITKYCRKEADKVLMELYHAADFFQYKRQAMLKVLLYGIEQGNEYYANRSAPNNEIVEIYCLGQKGKVRRIIDADELAQRDDKRPAEEQRDFLILNRIARRLYFDHEVRTNPIVLATLIKRHFDISLICQNPLEQAITERLQRSG